MKKKKQKLSLFLAISMCFTILFTMFTVDTQAATTITSNETGTHGGYDYELWKDNGTTSMTLNDGGAFSCSWSNIGNALFRKGKKYNETQTHQELGNISMKYACNYQPNGNSYLSVYGWTSDPLVEYYIIESWGNWRPPGATSKGTITVDGGTYDVYETTRVNQPSIKGNTTFQQYWSVRTTKKTSGTISVSEHFKAWEKMGMKMGKMYEVSLVVEGYQSSGQADVTSMSINIGDTTNPDPGTDPDPIPDYGTRSAFSAIEAEKYNTTTSSTIKVNGNGGSGEAIGYIESGDTITYKDIDFGSGASSFSALVASEQNSNIEVRLGSANGTLLGTLSDVSTGSWDTYEKKSTSISNVTGLQDIVLVFEGPANVDSFVFSGGNNNNTTKYYGDVNADGTVNIFDYLALKSFISGKGTLSSEVAADINIDSSINVIDLVNLKFILSGKRDLQPIKSTEPVTPTDPTKYDKVIALTFDDGPDTTLTPLVLDKLKKYNVPATFMMIGQKVNDSTSTVIKRIIDSGCEIGNHSWGFSSMDGMSEVDIKKSINDTNVAIQKYSGTTPKFFRAPNLATSNVMFNTIDLTFVNGITCNDWSQSTTAEQRANDIISGAKDGAILLMHDVQPLPHPTPEALDIIIPTLQKQGYKFVTLSELFKSKGVTLSPTNNKLYTYVP